MSKKTVIKETIQAPVSKGAVKQMLNQMLANRKKPRQRVSRRNTLIKKMHPYVLAQINPFLPECSGLRIPDDFTYPTGTVCMRANFEATATTDGIVCQVYTPDVANALVYPSTTADPNGFPAGGSLALPQCAALRNVSSSYRVVAYGLRITTDTALTASSGHIWVAHIPIDNFFIGTRDYATQAGSYYFPKTQDQISALPLSEKWSMAELAEAPLIVSGYRVDPGSYRFRDTDYDYEYDEYKSQGYETNSGWCGIGVYGYGLDVGQKYNVEVIMHVEYLQKGTSTFMPDSLPCPTNPELLQAATAVKMGTAVAHVERNDEASSGWVERAISRAMDVVGVVVNHPAASSVVGATYSYLTGRNRNPNQSFIRAERNFARLGY